MHLFQTSIETWRKNCETTHEAIADREQLSGERRQRLLTILRETNQDDIRDFDRTLWSRILSLSVVVAIMPITRLFGSHKPLLILFWVVYYGAAATFIVYQLYLYQRLFTIKPFAECWHDYLEHSRDDILTLHSGLLDRRLHLDSNNHE